MIGISRYFYRYKLGNNLSWIFKPSNVRPILSVGERNGFESNHFRSKIQELRRINTPLWKINGIKCWVLFTSCLHYLTRLDFFHTLRRYEDKLLLELISASLWYFLVNPDTPVGQKVTDEVVFRRFHGEGVEFFFKSGLTDPLPQIFDAHLLENTNLSLSSFHFSVSFYIKICFESDGFIAYSNEWD